MNPKHSEIKDVQVFSFQCVSQLELYLIKRMSYVEKQNLDVKYKSLCTLCSYALKPRLLIDEKLLFFFLVYKQSICRRNHWLKTYPCCDSFFISFLTRFVPTKGFDAQNPR